MITITGATGNVGGKLADILIRKGEKVRLVARGREKLEPFLERGAELAPGSILDSAFLAEAYRGANAVLTMLPADFAAPDVGAYQEKAGESILSAVKNSGVRRVVNLSSLGGHTWEGTGIVAGLARLEAKLNGLRGVSVLHLRPSYFMENFIFQIGMIKSTGMFGSAVRPDTSLPLVATRDIARIAAEKLAKPDFEGHSVLPIMGPRNYTMAEAAKALGAAIGRPGLKYVQFPPEQVKAALMQMGLSASVADSYNGLSEGINNGVMNFDKRTPESTTPTTIEEFASFFARVYNA
jgi:uncharacterized protein YbjT (DUF2867 family)